MVLGTGGTIAGTARQAGDQVGYTAAQIGIDALLESVATFHGVPLEAEQVAQVDSKDMDHAVWLQLAQRCAAALERSDVQGVVVTHGTDTLEESAYFLQRVLAPRKPLVLTGAMRPATALLSDGPQNLADAVAVARSDQVAGVLVVFAGQVHESEAVSKRHSFQLEAFSSGERGLLGVVEGGALRLLHAGPVCAAPAPGLLARLPSDARAWPRVAIVTSHAGADGAVVDALANLGVAGIVVAATGSGTVHRSLLEALKRARAAGIRVVRASRCAQGRVLPRPDDELPHAAGLSPVKARIALMLDLAIGAGE
ncbi:asparaginase [Ramlibacter sp. AW1]|uniref:Asparaginase n=2 Tax=Ramlibacter aurantiacus TaxID=2801330 RepID=A0A936ZES5_9BURK|nr:asparaginase [Ramlibacter aurantiacus]MBL0418948.1 asparaginase [Ramlibacter aurantiacus]